MFTDMPRRGMSQTVKDQWFPAKADAAGANVPSALLDLFRDCRPGVRKLLGGDA